MASVSQLFRLWAVYARIDLIWFLRDTKYCVANVLADLFSSLSAIAGVFLLAERFGNIGGMTQDQILLMLGYACMVDGVILMFFSMNNIAWISRLIGRGQLDHRLIQPVPLWMQFLTEGFIPVSGNSKLLLGTGLFVSAINRLNLTIDIGWILLLLVSIICSVAVILSCSYIGSTLAFYAPVAGEEISTTVIGLFSSLKSFPIGGLGLGARALLCTFIPVGLTAWLPTSQLLGLAQPGFGGALFFGITTVLVVVASSLFKKGLRHYARSGSVRYHERGHRR